MSRRELIIGHDLVSLRLSGSKFLALLIWLHVPVVAAIALSNHISAWHVALVMAVAASVATVAVWRDGGGLVARIVVAAALTMAPILMVYAGSGPWQADWHMYFFVVFAMLVTYVDWRPIAVAAALTVVHHVVLALLFPTAVFPEADLPRVMLHGAIVLVDAVMLFWIVRRMRLLFAGIANANATLEERIAERTTEYNSLNATLAVKLNELEGAFRELEREAAQRVKTAVRLDHLAHHDIITGLPNRVLLMDRLVQTLAAAERTGTEVLIIYLDLANFKLINDTMGHSAGDGALATVAGRITKCIRSGDTASRVGGDEFVIVCAATDGVKEIPKIVSRLIAAISEPLEVGSAVVSLGVSIGISLFPVDGANPEELIRMADAAMYRAKRSGPNQFHLYTPEIHEEMLVESKLRGDLERAILADEFVVYYQPVISLTSQAIIGAEALVRWQHPSRGLLPPSEFIAFAEEHGLIGQIGEAVLGKACGHVKRFAQLTNDEFTMAVNVSALQFRQAGFVDTVVRVLARHGVDRSRVEIEITESVIMDDAAAVVPILRDFEALGIKLSMDDFGTGYSSLAYIKNFPIQTLKIDRSFVKDIASNSTDQAIAATIIALAHNLGMRVIAEGVETREQLEQLRLLGADDMQGYLISRPLTATDFEHFVASYRAMSHAA